MNVMLKQLLERSQVYQRASKQKVRKKAGVLAKEYAEKKLVRQNPAKVSEKENQRTSKQKARKKPGELENECDAKAIARKKPDVPACFKAESQKKTGVLAKEYAEKS